MMNLGNKNNNNAYYLNVNNNVGNDWNQNNNNNKDSGLPWHTSPRQLAYIVRPWRNPWQDELKIGFL